MIKFQGISKVFDSDITKKAFSALTSVDFHLEEGSITGFLGANGAGKTTSLKILMGFIKATSGTVEFSEKLGRSPLEVKKNIGYLPERPFFYPDLKGGEFLQFMGQLNQMPRRELNREIKKWSKRLSIDFALDRKICTYSKGMLQRLGVTSSLLSSPRLLILDEPLSGLDPVGRKDIKDILKDLHVEGITIFFSSHIVQDVEEISSRLIVLEEGRLIYDGSTLDLLENNSQNKYIIDFIDVQDEFIRPFEKLIINTSGRLLQLEVEEAQKDKIVSQSVAHNVQIKQILKKQPTLEEIIYNKQYEL